MLHLLTRTLLALTASALSGLCVPATAQTPAPPGQSHAPAAAATAPAPEAASLDAVRRQLQEQGAEIERLRATLAEQTRLLNELLARTERAGASQPNAGAAAALRDAGYKVDGVAAPDAPGSAAAAARQTSGAAAQNPQTEQAGQVQALKKTTEALSRQLGSITFSGDVRLRVEGQFGQLNALANAENPAVVGNELSARHRARLRARLAVRGQIGTQFDWGLRFATGTTPDLVSTNQTLTDFFGRKTFALDQVYVSFRPSAVPGLRVQGGKFETPWLSTELTWDADNSPEGLQETYSRDFKSAGALKNLTLVAWQLPMLERQSAFVLNSAGQVDLAASGRGGRDLALYGAQARARLELTPRSALTVSAANLYFAGTQFITPAQFFGGTLQLPVTVNIPATATTPAQTVTTFATISRDLLVSGTSLGISAASTNATNRDGRLSSGYNLVDLIGQLELTHSKRWPVMLLFNVVTNTQVHDVVAAGGAGGANRVIENRERHGYWAEFQIGKTRERGDTLFNYTFVRIQKDAVLSPFNSSDTLQSTDVRTHRFIASYAADPRVTLSFNAFVSQRPHGLLGVFGSTPAGSLNRATTRLQLDTVFRF
ncbi:MAG: putative porin [Acidobacteria bacterium]|nr:putative porin [Acidobacteriota bacterium]